MPEHRDTAGDRADLYCAEWNPPLKQPMHTIDRARFEAARTAVVDNTVKRGIGTLGERALHAVVKHYLQADQAKHEIKLHGYVVDAMIDGHIFEIQTRHFGNLRAKLSTLLPYFPVTVVYPMQAKKWLIWIDPESGACSKPRLSPKRGNFHEAFSELWRIKPFLSEPNLSVLILLVDLEEYRLLNGWSRDRKRGSWRNDRLPLELSDALLLSGPGDYGLLLPQCLPSAFTSADYAKAAAVGKNMAQTTLNVLASLGLIAHCGKKGRLRLYARVEREDQK
jgi:hypothetical protein